MQIERRLTRKSVRRAGPERRVYQLSFPLFERSTLLAYYKYKCADKGYRIASECNELQTKTI